MLRMDTLFLYCQVVFVKLARYLIPYFVVQRTSAIRKTYNNVQYPLSLCVCRKSPRFRGGPICASSFVSCPKKFRRTLKYVAQ